MGVSKNRGKTPKMDGENYGKNPIKMDDLGVNTPIFGSTPICCHLMKRFFSRLHDSDLISLQVMGWKPSQGGPWRCGDVCIPTYPWGGPFPCNTGNTCWLFLQSYYLVKTSAKMGGWYTTPKCGVLCFFSSFCAAFFFLEQKRGYQSWVRHMNDRYTSPWLFGSFVIRRFWPFQWNLISWGSIITPSRSWC